MGQTSKQGLEFIETTNTAATRPKIVFVKASVASDVATISQTVSATTGAKTVNTCFSGKTSTISLFGGKKKFVPICHFCNRIDHIRPKCFEYQNTFKMSRYGNYHSRFATYKPRNAPKHKIDLRKIMSKKYGLKNLI